MKEDSAQIETIRGPEASSSQVKHPVIGFTVLFHPNISRIGEIAPMVVMGTGEAFHLSRLEPVFQTPFGNATDPLNLPFISRKPIAFHADPGGGVTIRRQESNTR